MGMEKTEFEFPDEHEAKAAAPAVSGDDGVEEALEVEVVDDTPEKDRKRKRKPAPAEVSEEELSEYSEKVQSRLKQFTRSYHDERRAKEAAQRERDEAVRVTQQILATNKAMEARVAELQKVQAEHAKESALAAKEAAQRKVKAAYEAGDADELVKANEALAKAVMREESAQKPLEAPVQQETPVVASQSSARQPVDERADQWQRDNKWFGADEEMTSFALGLHNKLIRQGVNPRSDDYYEKINARMRQVFPEQFEDEDDGEDVDIDEVPEPKTKDKPKKAAVVASATRSTAPRKVTLTASQVAIAKRLGVPLELYAKQVAEELRK